MKLSRDLWAGLVLLIIGTVVALYSHNQYRMGTIQSMGPGYMPFVLSIILIILGGVTAVSSQFGVSSEEPERKISWRKVIPVALAVLAFALTITKLGLIVATTLLVFIASLADKRFNLKLTLYLIISFCFISWVVFSYFLQMNMPAFW
ncbi:tripartite tricarboxylate transporter TctB family protein [Marinomonas rhizomae]|uniref:tripartite tricarboxylate transporter TctB family protein n=1 Tax=Marinomonas rhizomae TaxID=491948 RepID=UPI00210761DA|nr:tripartite tricarboxylate transporter TctB family protein [Marinomonas rhizomae]UTV98424.1 tripartite tricarboxylate transporter TctB family protein [Marinomonas rhizomae]